MLTKKYNGGPSNLSRIVFPPTFLRWKSLTHRIASPRRGAERLLTRSKSNDCDSAFPNRPTEIDRRWRCHRTGGRASTGADRRACQRLADQRTDHSAAGGADTGACQTAVTNRLAAARQGNRRKQKDGESKSRFHGHDSFLKSRLDNGKDGQRLWLENGASGAF
jgi:hypothetical protein